MSNPPDLLYSDTHEWVKVEGNDAVIGITSFAQEALGDITYVELPAIGSALSAGQAFGSVESVKAASDLVSPVNGKVTAVNTALDNAPELLNAAPYNDGWIIRIGLTDEPSGLMDAARYEEFCAAAE